MFYLSASQLFRSLTLVLILFTALSACKGPQGDPGPQGATGAAGAVGPAGPVGSANVIQISYGAKSWANTTGTSVELSMTGVNAEFVTKSAYFTYISTGTLWYSIPGEISSYGEFRTYVTPAANSTVLIKRVTTGTVLNATAIRVVLIPANDVRNGHKAAIDYTNYEAVRAYYNLPK